MLSESKDGWVSAKDVHEALAVRLPAQDGDQVLQTAVTWGRFAGLYEYDADRALLRLASVPRAGADRGDAPP